MPNLYFSGKNYNCLKIHMRALKSKSLKEAEYQTLSMILEELTQASFMHLFAMQFMLHTFSL